jgi:hypothetical protein
LIKLFGGNLKEISQFFEGHFGQNKEKKRFFGFSKWKHCPTGNLVILYIYHIIDLPRQKIPKYLIEG